MTHPPPVSCLMPTFNRRPFARRAISYFLRQDYEPKELIIVDDGDDPIGDVVPAGERIRYIRLNKRTTLGDKRNLACEQAGGDLLMHWDDDDWYAPRRIQRQVQALVDGSAEVCGLRQMLFYDPAQGRMWLYSYPANQKPWLAGGSLLYTRDFWKRGPFARLAVGEDTRFVWAHSLDRAVTLPDYDFYVALIHPGNTSPKARRGAYWAPWPGDMGALMGEDLTTYLEMGRPAPATVSLSPAPLGTPLPSAAERTSSMAQSTVAPPQSPVKFNLGCCDAALPGFINVDLVSGPAVDQVADLSRPWPWADGTASFVRAWDIIEHLPDKIQTMNELWRVLAPGGQAEIVVPTTDGSGAFQDPTHVAYWNRRSFLYYEAGNPYRERFARYYGIRAKFRVVRENLQRGLDGPRLTIVLEAVKP